MLTMCIVFTTSQAQSTANTSLKNISVYSPEVYQKIQRQNLKFKRGAVINIPGLSTISNSNNYKNPYKITQLGPCSDTTTFGNLGVAIPDEDTTGIVNSQVISGVTGTLGVDVQLKSVCFKIEHTWVGDLIVTLIAPNGTSINLTDRPGVPASPVGCENDNIEVCVDGGTGNSMENVCNLITPAIAGTYTASAGNDLGSVNNAGGSPNGTWQLIVSDNAADDTGTILEWSLVFDDGPVANWTSPGSVCATGSPVTLDPFVTGTSGGTWSGTGVSGNAFNPAGLSGPVAVTYSVNNTGTGCSDSETNIIFVDVTAPQAAFNFVSISLTTVFTNTSADATSYLWNFGDGNSSSLENPNHTYAVAGTYTVTLTASNGCGTNVNTQTVIVANCPDIIVDGSFEGGTPNTSWTEASTNFLTPLCDLGCDPNGITQARTGDFWAWFGGTDVFEEGSLSQNFTIAVNSSATLSFWLQMPACDSQDDYLNVVVDSDTLFSINGTSTFCGDTIYSIQSISLNAYDDGLPHLLTFISKSYGVNGGVTSFYVDDISLNVCTGIGFDETNSALNAVVMPVPANDVVTITINELMGTDVLIEVTDMVGKRIFSTSYNSMSGNFNEKIDVSLWNHGAYLVKIKSGNQIANRKIMIQ